METIKIYIENLFRRLPETEEVLRAREELGAVMEDKYNELKSAGKSENEAIGIVISEFGNIDELISEMKLEVSAKTETAEEGSIVDKSTVVSYLGEVKKNALFIPLGVFLILFGVVSLLILGNLTDTFNLIPVFIGTPEMEMTEGVGLISMFIFIIIGVIVIVFNAMKLGEYTMFDLKFRLTREALFYVKEQKTAFLPHKIRRLTAGISIILTSVLVLLIMSMFGGNVSVNLSVAVMLTLTGIGTGILINAGMYVAAYDKLLKKEAETKNNMVKSERLIGAIASGYWPIVIAVYLLVSFVWQAWGTSWVIWPVAALIFGAIAGVISVSVKD